MCDADIVCLVVVVVVYACVCVCVRCVMVCVFVLAVDRVLYDVTLSRATQRVGDRHGGGGGRDKERRRDMGRRGIEGEIQRGRGCGWCFHTDCGPLGRASE